MDSNPKRRISKDNPYRIKKDGDTYLVSFKDTLGIYQEIEIEEELYIAFDEFELEDIKEMNEFDRHTEHSEIYANNLEKRAKEKTISLEDEFIKKATFEELKKAIENLPEIQRRRIKKYYFDNKTLEQIGIEENCSKVAIKLCIDIALENIKEYL